MIFSQELVGNSRSAVSQWKAVQATRNAANINERSFAAAELEFMRSDPASGIVVNAGLIPQDVYREFDNTTVERFRSDDGDTFLNDLLPLSRSVNIGKLLHQYRKASDAGQTQTSMSGQIGVKSDQVEYLYDGSIIPIHDGSFYRNWREWNAQQSEGFDALVDDQREVVAALRRRLADQFLDGHTDKFGNYIVLDTVSWKGMRNDTRVAQVELGATGVNFDFTDTAQTGAAVKAAWIEVRDVLWITNNCEKDATYYVSREIASNFERKFSTSYDAKTIQQELADLQGVETIKTSSKLSGNEYMAFPLDGNAVKPIVGMGVNTVAMPRPVYNSNYEFVVWGATGFEVRTDYSNQKCALMAHEIA